VPRKPQTSATHEWIARRHSLISRAIVAALSFLIAAGTVQASPSVTKVEPPSWWAKHTLNPVRILIRGTELQGGRLSSVKRGIRVSRVHVNPNGTYLFADLSIDASLPPGEYPFILQTAAGRTRVPFRIEPPLAAANHFQGITNDDVIYLIMTDRFANGDVTNDRPPDSPPAANDRNKARAFHGGDLRGVIDRLPYLKDLGITALWLTPWYDNWNGINYCERPWCPHTYYHGYHAIDYYAVEDRFGNLETLRELVQKAHQHGIKIIQDQVANHVGSRHPWVTDPPLKSWFHGTLEQHTLNKFNNSVLLSPNSNQHDVRNTLDGWFSDDLPDMNQDDPEVARYEIQNALWWVGVTGIDGIRQDTIQYMPRSFIRQLSDALHRQYPRIWMVGEVFETDVAQTAFFIGGHRGWDGIDTNLDSVFDFALWDSSRKAFTGRLPMRAVRDLLKFDALYPDPSRLTTLVNSHDTSRFMSLPGASVEGAMMHIAFTLTVRGIPQLYYGEEIGMKGGEDPDNRQDFPGGFPGDQRDAFQEQGRTTDQQRLFDWTKRWLRLRTQHSSLRRGKLIDLFYDQDVYVFARRDRSETVIVGFNRSDPERQVIMPAATLPNVQPGESIPLLGGPWRATVDQETIKITLPARSAIAYRVR